MATAPPLWTIASSPHANNGESNAQSSAVMKSRKPVAPFQAERKSCQPWRSATMVGGIVVITLHPSLSCGVSMLSCNPFGTYRGVPKIFGLQPETGVCQYHSLIIRRNRRSTAAGECELCFHFVLHN